MKFFITAGLFFLSICVHSQNSCDNITYGVELTFPKTHYKRGTYAEVDSSKIPTAVWMNVKRQLSAMPNKSLQKKLRFKWTFVNKDNRKLHDRDKPVMNKEGKPIIVKYRFIYDFVVNDTMEITFGVDVDSSGRFLDNKEIPFALTKSIQAIISCNQAFKKALAVDTAIKGFYSGLIYYHPEKQSFIWGFTERLERRIDEIRTELKVVNINATTGKLSFVDKLILDNELKKAEIELDAEVSQ